MERRDFLRSAGGLISFYSLFAATCSIPENKQVPNFIVILIDDAGWNDVSYHGSEINTPAIDRLAREGVELDRFYVNPTCSPTRASLMTGRPASRYDILSPINYTVEHSLPPGTRTIATLLGSQGYDTAICGKWHLGWIPEAYPSHFGFDYSYGFLHGWIDHYTHRTRDEIITWHRNGEFFDESGHATDLITEDAVRYLENRDTSATPFFLYVAYSVPHAPLQAAPEWREPYRDVITAESRRYFAGMMSHFDRSVGQIIDTLNATGLDRNTLVVFASDNGATGPGERTYLTPKPTINYTPDHEKFGDNTPLRGRKGSVYEGGIRVPAVAWWPGTLEPQTCTEPMHIYDLLPTFTRLAGASTGGHPVEGIDIWPALTGGNLPADRVLFWDTGGQQAVQKNRWKLVRTNRQDETIEELFNLDDDPLEQHDLIDSEPDRRHELETALAQQLALNP